jgi:hypothetical protein
VPGQRDFGGNLHLAGILKIRRHDPMMPHERRVNVRKKPEYLAYLGLPSNNGGIVVDISEGGLGFRAIAPVHVDGPIHFRFAMDSAARIRAVGELAWIDETRKVGSLRFTQLPDEIREQIRAWTAQTGFRARAIPKATASVSAKATDSDIPKAEPAIEARAEAAPVSQIDCAHLIAAGPPLLYNVKPPVYSAPSYGLSMFPLESDSKQGATAVAAPASVATRHPIAAVGLTIALAFVVSIGIFSYVSTTRAGDWLFDWGEKMWSGSYSQTMPGDPVPPANSGPDSSNTNRH